ncbi:MAG: PadR family transcriptional regulator [Halobacteria archaeon]|nr:PadR family transcriptional regulator [Halobacteria archaeon]
MNRNTLESVVDSVHDSTESRRDGIRRSDGKTGLVLSCSMRGCEPSGSPWPVDSSWSLLTLQTLANQARSRYARHDDYEEVINRDIGRLKKQYDISAVLIAGHTDCRVLEDAYENWVGSTSDSRVGIETRLEPLCSVVGDGFEEGVLTESMSPRTVRHRLAEYNVCRQSEFLNEVFPSSVTVAGYVHDQDGVYGSFPDRRYLVAFNGQTRPRTIRSRIPDDTSVRVGSLLTPSPA